jgi:hypothetical protein
MVPSPHSCLGAASRHYQNTRVRLERNQSDIVMNVFITRGARIAVCVGDWDARAPTQGSACALCGHKGVMHLMFGCMQPIDKMQSIDFTSVSAFVDIAWA